MGCPLALRWLSQFLAAKKDRGVRCQLLFEVAIRLCFYGLAFLAAKNLAVTRASVCCGGLPTLLGAVLAGARRRFRTFDSDALPPTVWCGTSGKYAKRDALPLWQQFGACWEPRRIPRRPVCTPTLVWRLDHPRYQSQPAELRCPPAEEICLRLQGTHHAGQLGPRFRSRSYRYYGDALLGYFVFEPESNLALKIATSSVQGRG
jgi:hypothetical protein